MSPLTKNEIFFVADTIAAQGEMPSIRDVRKALGDRGSETTLQKYLKEWKQQLLAKNDVGCVFCASAAKENIELREKLTKYMMVVDQLKDSLTIMLSNPNRDVAVQEVITRLQ